MTEKTLAEPYIRFAQQRDWIDPQFESGSNAFGCRVLDNRAEQLTCYLCESIATALSLDKEPLIRLRAAFQAQYYQGKLEGLGHHPAPIFCDGVTEARNAVEGFFR